MVDIEANLRAYLDERKPLGRYASFDYCFNYFQENRERGDLPGLVRGEALQLSCLHLGFYLASWGMFRGSTEVLQHSVRAFAPVIDVIAHAPPEIWEIDADGYGDGSCSAVFKTARPPACESGSDPFGVVGRSFPVSLRADGSGT